MKKIFRNVIVCLSIVASGMAVTSCDGDNSIIGNMLVYVLQTLFNTNTQTNTYQYKGTCSFQVLVASSESSTGWVAGTDVLPYEGTTLALQETMKIETATQQMSDGSTGNTESTTTRTVNIEIPAVPLAEDATMENVMFNNLDVTQQGSMYVLSVGDNTLGNGKLTIDGKSYDISTVYVEASYNEDKYVIKVLSIYFGENDEYVVNVTFNGDRVTES